MNQSNIENPKRSAESFQSDNDSHPRKRLAADSDLWATADGESWSFITGVDDSLFAQEAQGGLQSDVGQLEASFIDYHQSQSVCDGVNAFLIDSHNGEVPIPASVSDEEEQICFGMLSDVETQLRWPSLEKAASENLDGVAFLPLMLEIKPDHGLIRANGQAVAVLQNKAFHALSICVANTPKCVIFTWVLPSEWAACMTKARDPKLLRKGVVMKIDLVLSGPRSSGDCVAVDLGSRQYYLQEPHMGLCHCPYENPQSFIIPSSLIVDISNIALDLDAQLPQALQQEDDAELVDWTMFENPTTQLDDLIQNIDFFLEVLPAKRTIAPAGTDGRFISTLFSHQKEGQSWMLQREEHTPSEHDSELWEKSILPSGEVCYQHSITGAKSKTASDFKGGILADDMGLGKTFTTLAAIYSSLGHASEFAKRSNAAVVASRATLVVVPSELLLNTWASEIERHFYPGTIRYVKYHSSGRRDLVGTIAQQDIVLTTYGTIMADRRGASSIIHKIDWFRLVLDEAHLIRNWGSKQFNAVHSISSHIRWCLTGTPIQNSLDDLGALIRFLKMPIFSEPATFRRYVTKLRHDRAHSKGEFNNLKMILSSVCLRQYKDIMPKSQGQVYEDREPRFTPKEREQYHNLELACKRAIAISSKKTINAPADGEYHTVMEALLRLRIFCNTGVMGGALDLAGIMARGKGSKSRPDEVLSFLQQRGEAMCYYCSVDIISLGATPSGDESGTADGASNVASLTRCWHLVCRECTQQYRSGQVQGQPFSCPICKGKHGSENVFDRTTEPEQEQNSLQGPADDRLQRYPSKIAALVKDVRAHSLTDKCVIFSFWKKSLDIVGSALDACGVKYLRVDGDVSPKKRGTILFNFQNRQACTVLLITFSTGAVGLNGLTVANRVHILEPQWNPAAEKQAIGRLLRLDQSRKVTIVRYAMERSIEEVVQKKQLRKMQLARGGFAKQFSAEEKRALESDQLNELQAYFDGRDAEDVMEIDT